MTAPAIPPAGVEPDRDLADARRRSDALARAYMTAYSAARRAMVVAWDELWEYLTTCTPLSEAQALAIVASVHEQADRVGGAMSDAELQRQVRTVLLPMASNWPILTRSSALTATPP